MTDLKAIARHVQSHGAGKDKILAHITPNEAALLAKLNGGSVNPRTGLPSFGFFSDVVSGATGGIAGLTLGGLAGGLSGHGASNAGTQAFNTLNNDVQPLLKAGQGQLSQFQSGQLTPGDQASLMAADQAGKSANAQYFADAGLGKSTQLLQTNQQVDTNSVMAHQKLLDQYLANSEGLYGIALGPLGQAVGYQFQGNVAAQQTLSNALGSLAGLAGDIFGNSGGDSGGGGGGNFASAVAPFVTDALLAGG